MKFEKHTLWMLAGCGLPLLFIFWAPTFGITGNAPLFIFIAAMFVFHRLMPVHHHKAAHGQENTESTSLIIRNHEDYQP
jgi:hypothetical protein